MLESTVKDSRVKHYCSIFSIHIIRPEKKIPVFQVTLEKKKGLVGWKNIFSFKTFFLNINTFEK